MTTQEGRRVRHAAPPVFLSPELELSGELAEVTAALQPKNAAGAA
ncbi:MAG: hypothetical protein Marn2KO_36290 [Marinobacter nauticus]